MKKILMVDVDSTLYDADPLFAQLAKEAGLPWFSRAPYWFQPQDIGVDRQKLTNMFRKAHSREIVMQQIPYPGAVSTLLNLKVEGWTVWYVSSRHPQAQTALEDWIKFQGFPDSENTVAIMDKIAWLDEKRPDVVVDDRVRTMIHARFVIGATVFSMRHQHNTNLDGEVDGIHICDTWSEIGQGIYNTQKELVA